MRGARIDGVPYLGCLFLLMTLTSRAKATFDVKGVTWTDDEKTIELMNAGGEIKDQEVKLYVSTGSSWLSPKDMTDSSPAFTQTLPVAELPSTGSAIVVDASSAKVPGSMTTCGQYFLVATVKDAGSTGNVAQSSISAMKGCQENIDLKFQLEAVEAEGTPELSMSAGQNIVSQGATLSILNEGPGDLALRSAVDSPEVAVYLGPASWSQDLREMFQQPTGTLQEVMERALTSNKDYFDKYGIEDFTQLRGWDMILVNKEAETSISLAANQKIELDLAKLKAPSTLPCEGMGTLVLMIDPHNRTKDSNRTNNVALFPVGLECGKKTSSQAMCTIIPNAEHDGRSATLMVNVNGSVTAYQFKTRKGREGFRQMDPKEIREEMNAYTAAVARMERLKDLGKCPEMVNDDMKKALESSLAMDLLKTLQALKTGLEKINVTDTQAARGHDMILTFVGLAEDLLNQTLKSEGIVRQIVLNLINYQFLGMVRNQARSKGPYQACMMAQARILQYVGGPAAQLAQEMLDLDNLQDFSFSSDSGCPADQSLFSRCSDGKGLRRSQICDGIPYCADGLDEDERICAHTKFGNMNPECALNCTGSTEPSRCIPTGYLCDGIADCSDEFDENKLLCPFGNKMKASASSSTSGSMVEAEEIDSSYSAPEDDLSELDKLKKELRDVPPNMRALLVQVYLRLATGSTVEELEELTFLPMSTRRYIKKFYDYVTSDTYPQVCAPWRSETVATFLRAYMLTKPFNNPMAMTEAKVDELLNFLKNNISVEVRNSLQGNGTQAKLIDLWVNYIDVLKDNKQTIISLIKDGIRMIMMNPEELCMMVTSIPGPEPDEDMQCLRMAQRDVNKILDADAEEEDLFFQNPLQQAYSMAMKKNMKSVFWRLEEGSMYRGRRSKIVGLQVWDKVAICSCPSCLGPNTYLSPDAFPLKGAVVMLKDRDERFSEKGSIISGTVVIQSAKGNEFHICGDEFWGSEEAYVVCQAIDPSREIKEALKKEGARPSDYVDNMSQLDCKDSMTPMEYCKWSIGKCMTQYIATVECLFKPEAKK